MGQKADDCAGFFGCYNCHDIMDGRKEYPTYYDADEYLNDILRAYYRTIRRLIDKGVIK